MELALLQQWFGRYSLRCHSNKITLFSLGTPENRRADEKKPQ